MEILLFSRCTISSVLVAWDMSPSIRWELVKDVRKRSNFPQRTCLHCKRPCYYIHQIMTLFVQHSQMKGSFSTIQEVKVLFKVPPTMGLLMLLESNFPSWWYLYLMVSSKL